MVLLYQQKERIWLPLFSLKLQEETRTVIISSKNYLRKMMAEYPDHKTNLDALRRIEGQIRGIIRMIEEKRYCIDILTQINSADAAVMRVHDKILEVHLNGCVKSAIVGKSNLERQKKIDEIFGLLQRFRK